MDEVKFKEGALVTKGQVLFVIDPRPFVAELNSAKAQLEEAKAGVTRSTAQVVEAQAGENRAKAGVIYTKRQLERSQKVVSKGAVTPEEIDLQKSELRQNEADLQRAKAQIESSRAAIGVAKAELESAKAAVSLAELNLEYTNVIAPVSGRISRELVTEGNFVQAGGTLLTTIVSVDPVYAYFDVDERIVLRVRQLIREGKAKSARDVELPVNLGLANEEGFPRQGTIDFVDNQINPKTGTLRVRGIFDNPGETLSPGMFVRVRVPIGFAHRSLLVSDRAIDNDQGQKVLYVLSKDNEVVSRPIRAGALHDGLRAIEDGLQPGERVIVAGVQQVRPGDTVAPRLVDMPRSEVRNHDGTARLAAAAP